MISVLFTAPLPLSPPIMKILPSGSCTDAAPERTWVNAGPACQVLLATCGTDARSRKAAVRKMAMYVNFGIARTSASAKQISFAHFVSDCEGGGDRGERPEMCTSPAMHSLRAGA